MVVDIIGTGLLSFSSTIQEVESFQYSFPFVYDLSSEKHHTHIAQCLGARNSIPTRISLI